MYEDFRDWYVSYCHDEYDSDDAESKAAFDHAYETGEELGILYTTFVDDEDGTEHDLQISVRLNPAEEAVYVDNQPVYSHRFLSLAELYNSFEDCDFNDIYGWAMMYHVRKEEC